MITENRWLHILGVARQAKRLAEKMRPNDVQFAEDMFLLGMLHDFGYEFIENGKGHAAAGAEILKRQGYKNWKIIAEHGNPEIKEMSDALFILNCADITVSAEGKNCTMEERIAGIAERYGNNSPAFTKAVTTAGRLRTDCRYPLINTG